MNNRFLSPSRLFLWLFVALIPAFSTAQSLLDSLPPIDSLTDYQVNDRTQQFAAQIRYFKQALSEKALVATTNRSVQEDRWKTAKADSTISPIDIDSLAGLLKVAKSAEKEALRDYNKATKLLELAQKMSDSDNLSQRKNLLKLWQGTRELNGIVYYVPDTTTPAAPTEPEKKPKKKKAKPDVPVLESTPADIVVAPATPDSIMPKKKALPIRQPLTAETPTVRYDPVQDVMLHPPALPCDLAVNTRDEFSGERYRRTVSIELFRHTPAALKNYLQGKPNVLCEAAIASAGANSYLYLTITINDPNPRKAFGKLEKGSLATLWFMDGSSFNLYNQEADEGVQNPEYQTFVFKVQYQMSPDVLKKVRRIELDRIRIAWSSGYEDYDVQYVQLLMGQAKCLFD